MGDTVLNSTGSIQWDGCKKVGTWTYTHNFATVNCLSANTLSVLLPANIFLLGSAYKIVTGGSSANLAIGTTDNLNYVCAAADLSTTGVMVAGTDIATTDTAIGADRYLVINPDADAITGVVKVVLVIAQF